MIEKDEGEPAEDSPQEQEQRTRDRQGDPKRSGFIPETMDKAIIAIPLLDDLQREEEGKERPYIVRRVIIDLNLEYKGGRDSARNKVEALIDQLRPNFPQTQLLVRDPQPPQYVFARMTGPAIRELVRLDDPGPATTARAVGDAASAPTVSPRDPTTPERAIYRVWPDFDVEALITKSVSTVKADAARSSFAAMGNDIVWAVVDSGIDEHPHFALHQNLMLPSPLTHVDFTDSGNPLKDEKGHGTHVAGIIAGEIELKRNPDGGSLVQGFAVTRSLNQDGATSYSTMELTAISGMAPKCKLVSLKVLDANGKGTVSDIISALEKIQQINGYGRRLLIHGVNLSVGYDFKPEWFACGQSPLCVEVDRLVRSGVAVIVAAGNTGYGFVTSEARGTVPAGMGLSINDPGNAELAVTVGATHREMPHTYGVSYFSSKGPTGDGRLKPDVIAPGEKVLSCAAGGERARAEGQLQQKIPALYVEQSGTSMAAPHVSGIIAAFLSIRREYIGNPEEVKRIFMSTATDLKRDRYFQGSGLVDLMRAIQSV